MTIDTWQKLAWRYRYNPEVTIDVEGKSCTWDGDTHTNLREIVGKLSHKVLSKACRVLRLDKGNGQYRYCYSPNALFKEHLQSRLGELEFLLGKADPRGMMHAFRNNYNAVTNAKAHIGYKYTAKFDLKDFFGTIPRELVEASVPAHLLGICLIEDRPKQGLPTSPLIASLALQPVAYVLDDALRKLNKDCRMTVYADDISVSFNDRTKYEEIKEMVYKHIKDAGLQVNYKKTRLKFGHKNDLKRIICGVAVGETDVQRTRKTRMAIQKALYKQQSAKALGLMEWSACKEPRSRRGL